MLQRLPLSQAELIMEMKIDYSLLTLLNFQLRIFVLNIIRNEAGDADNQDWIRHIICCEMKKRNEEKSNATVFQGFL